MKFMNSFDGQDKFRHIKSSNVEGKDLVLDKHSHQISAREKLHQHVKILGVLECGVKLDNPRAITFGQNIPFRLNVRQLVFFELKDSIRWCELKRSAMCGNGKKHTISDLSNDFKAYTLLSVFRFTRRTSPNAPFPMIFIMEKFSGRSFVRRKRKYCASVSCNSRTRFVFSS